MNGLDAESRKGMLQRVECPVLDMGKAKKLLHMGCSSNCVAISLFAGVLTDLFTFKFLFS
jgi:hypothetical protein